MPAETQGPLVYAYTQTLHPKYYKLRAKTQYEKTLPDVRKYLKMFTLEYTLIPELTKKSNIHYHGIVKFIDIDQYHSFQDNVRSIGFCTLASITDLQGWLTYISKDKMITEGYLEETNIVHRWQRPVDPHLNMVLTKPVKARFHLRMGFELDND